MPRYLQSKGLNIRGHVSKETVEQFLTSDQVKAILAKVEDSAEDFNKNWRRDYAAIYLGFMFGLRIGETCLLERRHFDDLEKSEVAHLPTLRSDIVFVCRKCKHKRKVSYKRIGRREVCSECGKIGIVGGPISIPEKDPPVIEGQVVSFVLDYIEQMRPEQRWLFESKPGYHISESYLSRIFNTYSIGAGLSPKYSWNSLRHGRGVRLWSMFKDITLVRDGLRQTQTKSAERYAKIDAETAGEYRKKLERVAINPKRKRARTS